MLRRTPATSTFANVDWSREARPPHRGSQDTWLFPPLDPTPDELEGQIVTALSSTRLPLYHLGTVPVSIRARSHLEDAVKAA